MRRTGRPRVWTNATLSVILQNPAYKGEGWANRWRQFKTADGKLHQEPRPRNEWVALPFGTYPRLVDDDTWNVAQEVKAQNKAFSTRCSRTPEAFLLRAGFVRCFICGWSMSTRREGRSSVGRYFCTGKAHGLEVPADLRDDEARAYVSIPSEAIDRAVWEHVSALLSSPDYLDRAIA